MQSKEKLVQLDESLYEKHKPDSTPVGPPEGAKKKEIPKAKLVTESVSSKKAPPPPEPPLGPTPPPPPQPKPVSVQNEIIKQTVSKAVDEVRNQRPDAKAQKEAAEFGKQISKAKPVKVSSEDEAKRRATLIDKLLLYEEKYSGKIAYNFKPEYVLIQMPTLNLETEAERAQIAVNTQYAPNMLKDVLIQGAQLIQSVSNYIDSPYFNLGQTRADESFVRNIEVNAEEGYFDSELEQLAIEFREYFNAPPLKRLFFKVSRAALTVSEQNKRMKSVNPTNMKKAAEFANKNKDL